MRPLRTSFPVMGTVASLVIARTTSTSARAAEAAIRQTLSEAEARFSPFLASSELSAYRRRPAGHEPSHEMTEILTTCDLLTHQTSGHFWPFDPRGRFDPSAYVKGWAAEQAVARAVAAGASDVCLNVGGDVRTAGAPTQDRPWRVAIRSPLNGSVVVAVVSADGDGQPLAVATSGDYERGAHIWSGALKHVATAPMGALPATAVSVTVVGPNLGFADAYSTAAWATVQKEGPAAGLALVEALDGYEALIIVGGSNPVATTRMSGHLVQTESPVQPAPTTVQLERTIPAV